MIINNKLLKCESGLGYLINRFWCPCYCFCCINLDWRAESSLFFFVHELINRNIYYGSTGSWLYRIRLSKSNEWSRWSKPNSMTICNLWPLNSKRVGLLICYISLNFFGWVKNVVSISDNVRWFALNSTQRCSYGSFQTFWD